MATKIIVIDGYIGNYGFSKQYIRGELSGNSKNAVTAKISSLGGAVDDALNIHDQFSEHGNVTAELSAFVASSATLISLGAKTVRMNENSFYLIHKAMNWVDEWGTMNEDEIEELIGKLEKQKQQLAKITLQLAKMYVKKTGKTLEEIINLMKEEIWLTADEALEWGFVDEIFAPEVAQNYLEDLQMVAMITSSGYPAPPRKNQTQQAAQNIQLNEENFFKNFWNRFKNKQDEDSKTNLNNKNSMKQHEKLNAVLGVPTLEATDDHVSFNEKQLGTIEAVLSGNEQAVADARATALVENTEAVTAAETERDTANTERDTAQTNLTDAVAAFDGIDQTIASAKSPAEKATAIRTLLAAKPGAKPGGNLDTEDPAGGTTAEEDWELINNLPHNKAVDQNS